MGGKYCKRKSDVPSVKHYAIIMFGSYTVAGDERSRTNPGHGYPEHTESTAEYLAYLDRAEWETQIQRLTLDKFGSKDFAALVVDPVVITVTTKVEVKG